MVDNLQEKHQIERLKAQFVDFAIVYLSVFFLGMFSGMLIVGL